MKGYVFIPILVLALLISWAIWQFMLPQFVRDGGPVVIVLMTLSIICFTFIFENMKPFGVGPKGVIIRRLNSLSGTALVTGEVPSVTDLDRDPIEVIETGDYIKLDADKGIVEITKP